MHVYADLAWRAQLLDLVPAVAWIARGLGGIAPLPVLGLYSGSQLRKRVCGSPAMDLAMLKRHTRLEGYTSDSPPVRYLFQVLARLSPRRQAQVLRFVWARDRLPPTDDGFPMPFVIARMPRDDPDRSLPASHTCSFQLDLPTYSSADVLERQLLLAAESAAAYDLDGGARGVAE